MRILIISYIFIILYTFSSYADVLLDQNFDDGDLSSWSFYSDPQNTDGPSDWKIQDNQLYQSSNIYGSGTDSHGQGEYDRFTGTIALAGENTWTDYSFGLEVTPTSNDIDDGLMLLFRVQDEKNYFRYLEIEGTDNKGPLRRLDKCINGKFTTLAEVKTTFERPPYGYCLNIFVEGDNRSVPTKYKLVADAMASKSPDHAINVITQYEYDGYGNRYVVGPIAGSTKDMKETFTGKELDETSHYYFGARYYDADDMI